MKKLNWGETLIELIKNPNLVAINTRTKSVLGWDNETLYESNHSSYPIEVKTPVIKLKDRWIVVDPKSIKV